MVATVDVLADKLNLEKNSTRTGFHWPPFTTVNHLHLHVISPVESMSFVKNMMFKPNSIWFVSVSMIALQDHINAETDIDMQALNRCDFLHQRRKIKLMFNECFFFNLQTDYVKSRFKENS